MKNLKRVFAGFLAIFAAFVFFGCADTEEDDELVVQFTVSGSDSDSTRTVTMKAPDGYEDKTIYIVYTLDESTPDLVFTKANYKATASVVEYVDWGTASLYENPLTLGETTTVKAIAFYVDEASEKCVKGSEWSTKKVTVTSEKTAENVNEAAGASSGTFSFTLASTGNSNTTHYFDTSSTNVFKLNASHPTVYYQTSFSTGGKGKGKWYLYMRDLNGGLVKKDGVNFLANGTYTGSCFDDYKTGEVADGTLILSNTDSTTGSVTITDKSTFSMFVSNTGASETSGSSDTLGTFTVADAK